MNEIGRVELVTAKPLCFDSYRVNSATGSFVSDLVADEHTWSDELYRICEFESGSNLSIRKLRDIVHPEDLPAFDAVIARGIAGHDVEFEFRIVTY